MWNRQSYLAPVWILALFLLQNSLQFLLSDSVPWIVLSGVLFYGMQEGPIFGCLVGGYAGFFPDLFGTGPLGVSMAVFGGLGYLAGVVGSKLFSESVVTQVMLSTAAYIVAVCLHLLIHGVFLQGQIFSFVLFREAFRPVPIALMAAASPIIFAYLKKGSSSGRRRRRAWV